MVGIWTRLFCLLLCIHCHNIAYTLAARNQSSASRNRNMKTPRTAAFVEEDALETPLPTKDLPRQVPRQVLAPKIERDMSHIWSSLIAGVGSGALASVICAPLDLVRTRMQVWTQVKGSPTLAIPQMLGDIIRKEGIAGCFRGLGATLMTVPTFWGVYFPLYDDFKRTWTEKHPDVSPTWIHMGSAVGAGVISDVICNPMFVVRTRLQTEALHSIMPVDAGSVPKKMSMLATARSLYHEGGPLIFWRGMTANLMGLSHVGVQFPLYEKFKKSLRQHKTHESALDLLLASGASKMMASLLTYPHEVIRSRMMDSRTQVGFVETCQRIYTTQGFSGFYAGLPVTLIRVIPNTCITFVTYELFLRLSKNSSRK
jgi:solute carrier family 25 folate transporter 32